MSLAAVRSAAKATAGLMAIAAAIGTLALAVIYQSLGPGEYGFLDYAISGICIEAGDDTVFHEFAGAANPRWYPPAFNQSPTEQGVTPLLEYPPWQEKDTTLWWRFSSFAITRFCHPALDPGCPAWARDTVWSSKPDELSYDSIGPGDTAWIVSLTDLPWAYQVTSIAEPGGPGQVVLASHTGRFPLGTCG